MQVGRFWLITTDTINGPWHVASLDDPRSVRGDWYVVNKDTGKSKLIGPVRSRGTNYCDRARAEAIRRNEALGFKQEDGKQAHIVQTLNELGPSKITEEAAAVALFDKGIREADMFGEEYQIEPFAFNVRMNLSQIERGVSNIKIDNVRMWVKRHNF